MTLRTQSVDRLSCGVKQAQSRREKIAVPPVPSPIGDVVVAGRIFDNEEAKKRVRQTIAGRLTDRGSYCSHVMLPQEKIAASPPKSENPAS